MRNTVKCNSCENENAYFRLNCTKCNNYLRARVWNINLWHNIRLLIESPIKAYEEIIWSEHKNFVLFLVIVTSIKLMVDSFFLQMFSEDTSFLLNGFFTNYLVVLAEYSVYIYLFSLLMQTINKSMQLETRIKDIITIIVYSLVPSAFALLFLFLVEIILFGGFLFSINPPPIIIKPTLGYILIGLEIMVIIWSVFLLSVGFYTLSKLKFYSFITSIIFFVILLVILFLTPYNII